jgi:hypothetical protein
MNSPIIETRMLVGTHACCSKLSNNVSNMIFEFNFPVETIIPQTPRQPIVHKLLRIGIDTRLYICHQLINSLANTILEFSNLLLRGQRPKPPRSSLVMDRTRR